MPLRATIDGTDYIASGMSRNQFLKLKADVSAHRATLTLPCCKGRGFLRISPKDFQYFAHAPGSACAHKDSVGALILSSVILQTASALGLSFEADVHEQAARIPVRVAAPDSNHHIAFLIQDRPQTPKTLRRLTFRANQDLSSYPVFLIPYHPSLLSNEVLFPAETGRYPRPLFLFDAIKKKIYPDATAYPVPYRELFRLLLSGEMRLSCRATAPTPDAVRALVTRIPCPDCGQPFTTYYLVGHRASVCGRSFDSRDQDRYRPEILAAVRNELRALHLPLGHVEIPAGTAPSAATIECIHCRSTVGEPVIAAALRAKKPKTIASLSLAIRWKTGHDEFVAPHWCVSSQGKCCYPSGQRSLFALAGASPTCLNAPSPECK